MKLLILLFAALASCSTPHRDASQRLRTVADTVRSVNIEVACAWLADRQRGLGDRIQACEAATQGIPGPQSWEGQATTAAIANANGANRQTIIALMRSQYEQERDTVADCYAVCVAARDAVAGL